MPAYKVKLIVNRYDRHMGLSKDVIGTALHTEIYHLIPADYDAIQKALMEGKPMARLPASFGKSVAALVDRLARFVRAAAQEQFAFRVAFAVLADVVLKKITFRGCCPISAIKEHIQND